MPIGLIVTTKSNLYIGGVPRTFEIGGVDMYTATDYDGKPYIPASAFKVLMPASLVKKLLINNAGNCSSDLTYVKVSLQTPKQR